MEPWTYGRRAVMSWDGNLTWKNAYRCVCIRRVGKRSRREEQAKGGICGGVHPANTRKNDGFVVHKNCLSVAVTGEAGEHCYVFTPDDARGGDLA